MPSAFSRSRTDKTGEAQPGLPPRTDECLDRQTGVRQPRPALGGTLVSAGRRSNS
jgi:hypothetical protein